jgi:hypothetical protein
VPGQMEYEIKLGDRLVVPVDEVVIFDRAFGNISFS